MIKFDEHIFQLGCFNHQLAKDMDIITFDPLKMKVKWVPPMVIMDALFFFLGHEVLHSSYKGISS